MRFGLWTIKKRPAIKIPALFELELFLEVVKIFTNRVMKEKKIGLV